MSWLLATAYKLGKYQPELVHSCFCPGSQDAENSCFLKIAIVQKVSISASLYLCACLSVSVCNQFISIVTVVATY